MKLIQFIFSLLIFSAVFKLQSQTLVFDYNQSGQVIQRRIQTMSDARLAFPASRPDSLPAINFSVFPNPASQAVNLQGALPEQVKEASLSIANLEGQILKTDVYRGGTKTIPVNDLANGVYLLEIRYSKKRASTYKIIISNY